MKVIFFGKKLTLITIKSEKLKKFLLDGISLKFCGFFDDVWIICSSDWRIFVTCSFITQSWVSIYIYLFLYGTGPDGKINVLTFDIVHFMVCSL